MTQPVHLGCGDLGFLMERQCAALGPMHNPYFQPPYNETSLYDEYAAAEDGKASGCFGSDWLHIDGDQAALPQASGEYMQLVRDTRGARVDGIHQSSIHTLNHDIQNGLPFPNSSIESVFSEHLVEHLNPNVLVDLLREVWRILLPGGILRISTPDLEKYLHGYVEERVRIKNMGDGDQNSQYTKAEMRDMYGKDTFFLEEHAAKFPPSCCSWGQSKSPQFSGAHMINNIMRSYGHKDGWIYDKPSITELMTDGAGIPASSITVDEYRPQDLVTKYPHLAGLDLEIRADESMYLRLRKPQARLSIDRDDLDICD